MNTRKTVILATVCLIVIMFGGSTISQSLQTDQTPQLRDDLIVYDYTVNATSIQFRIHFVNEINKLVSQISAWMIAPDYGKISDLIFKLGSSGNWTASLSIDSSTPRYITVNYVMIVFNNFEYSTHLTHNPFSNDLIDLQQGIDTRLSTFPTPTFSNLTISPLTANISDSITISMNVNHPHPELLAVKTVLGSNRGGVTLTNQGNGVFSGSTIVTGYLYDKTNISSVTFQWSHDFIHNQVSYYNNLNYTSPILNVINGTTDYNPASIDLNNLSYDFYYSSSNQQFLNISVPITDASNIYDPFFQLTSPNSTFLKNYYLSYNNQSAKYEATIFIPTNFPEFLQMSFLEVDDGASNSIYYVLDPALVDETSNSYFFDFPVMQRPLAAADSPDISGPALNGIVPSSATINYNGSITVNITLSDPSGYYNIDYHDNKQTLYFNTSDGKSFFVTSADQPVYESNMVKYLSYSFNVLYPLFDSNLPTSVTLWKIVVADNLQNTAIYTSSADFDPVVFSIQYPNSWYISSSSSDTTSGSTSNGSTSESANGGFLPYPLLGLSVLVLLPILKRRS